MPPPSPVWSSPLMITGASWKPFSAVRSPVVPLNENVSPGRDQRAVDQLRDEGDVVQAARDAAVGRVVAADDAGDPHRLRLGGRALGRASCSRRASAVRAVGEIAAASSAFAVAGTSMPRPGSSGTIAISPRRAPRSVRRPEHARRSCAACRTRLRLRRPRSRAASRRRSGATGARRSASAAASSACRRTRAAPAPRALSRPAGARPRGRPRSRRPGRRGRAAPRARLGRAARAHGRSSPRRRRGRGCGRSGRGRPRSPRPRRTSSASTCLRSITPASEPILNSSAAV